MFYHLAQSIDGFQAGLALTVSTLFIILTLAKEKRDERKRA